MPFDGDEQGPSGSRLQVPLYKNAKEKNRQAQRRFRERQKGLITALKDRAHNLDKRVEEQAQIIHTLKEENNMLKLLLAEKAYAPQLMQQPQLQQPTLAQQGLPPPGLSQPGLQQSTGSQKLHMTEQAAMQHPAAVALEASKV